MANRIDDKDFEQRVYEWVNGEIVGKSGVPMSVEDVVWAIVQDEGLLNEVTKRRREHIREMNRTL